MGHYDDLTTELATLSECRGWRLSITKQTRVPFGDNDHFE